MYVYVAGARMSVDPKHSIGKGGEADVFAIGKGLALKLFKQPNHPDYAGDPSAQAGAKDRLAVHQRKLRTFPANFPSRVVVPLQLATDQSGKTVLGYTMRLVDDADVLLLYGDRAFREKGVSTPAVLAVFRDLHGTVSGIHRAGAIIGDFNDLNVLAKGGEAHIIDADSFQFGPFLSCMFTPKFLDPLLFDPKQRVPVLGRPYQKSSDWYAYAVMLMQSLLYVDPYGGVHRPKNPLERVLQQERSLHRITVFDPNVLYPKPAMHYRVLPDELLDYFHRIFVRDERSEFPLALLQSMRWTTCAACGTEHARKVCPVCVLAAPAAVREVMRVRGNVLATTIFRTDGIIVHAATHKGKLRWLYHQDNAYKREDGTKVITAPLDPHIRFRIKGTTSLAARGTQLAILTPKLQPRFVTVDQYRQMPIFDANGDHLFWLQGGQLFRDGDLAPILVGNVLQNQTLIWAGPAFGFGFYRAGKVNIAFVFDAERRGLNDTVQLPPIRGELTDATCVFGTKRCWLLTATRENGKTLHTCAVIRADGAVEATASADEHDGSWLGTLRGKCAAGALLIAATDSGLVRVEVENGRIIVTKEFPDTEPFVDEKSHIFAAHDGIYVVSRKEIIRLQIT